MAELTPFDLVLFPEDRASPIVAELRESAARIAGLGTDVEATLRWAQDVGRMLGAEATAVETWAVLSETAAGDVAAARVLEPHLDALGILAEAARAGFAPRLEAIGAGDEAGWGVFAAEAAGMRLVAEQGDEGWMLRGTKPWCSLAAYLSHALVTAWVSADERRLFAVDLRDPRVTPRPGPWHSRGLARIASAPVDFDGAPAVEVGEAGWYLSRPGFARGGIGVAACWWGAVVPLRTALLEAASTPRADQLAAVHLARADTALWASRAVLVDAARAIDGGTGEPQGVLAARTRAIVADAAETVLRESDRALGPLPLVADEAHARRVADARIYLRQHHADRDLARLGRTLVDAAVV